MGNGNCSFNNKNKNEIKNGVYVFKNVLYSDNLTKCSRVEVWHENELITINFITTSEQILVATFIFFNNALIKSIKHDKEQGIVRIDRYLNDKYNGITVIKRNGLVFQEKVFSNGELLETFSYNERGLLIT